MQYSGECMECGARSDWDGRRATEVECCPRCGSGPGVWMVSKYDRKTERWETVDTWTNAFARAARARR